MSASPGFSELCLSLSLITPPLNSGDHFYSKIPYLFLTNEFINQIRLLSEKIQIFNITNIIGLKCSSLFLQKWELKVLASS